MQVVTALDELTAEADWGLREELRDFHIIGVIPVVERKL